MKTHPSAFKGHFLFLTLFINVTDKRHFCAPMSCFEPHAQPFTKGIQIKTIKQIFIKQQFCQKQRFFCKSANKNIFSQWQKACDFCNVFYLHTLKKTVFYKGDKLELNQWTSASQTDIMTYFTIAAKKAKRKQIWTADHLTINQTLYQLSYTLK